MVRLGRAMRSQSAFSENGSEILERIEDADCQLLIGHRARRWCGRRRSMFCTAG